MAFSKSVLGIHNIAEDLLDWLRLEHRQENKKSQPIILIAYSLGGLIVKKTLNMAWNNPATYGSLLEKVFGLVFFGVPHRGANLAYWAGFPASLLDHALLGFGGNRSFLRALQKNLDKWRTISQDFVQRRAQLSSIQTFFETEKLGNILVSSDPLQAIYTLEVLILTPLRLLTRTQHVCFYQIRDAQALPRLITLPCVNSTAWTVRNMDQSGEQY
jgi:hypothetical protein